MAVSQVGLFQAVFGLAKRCFKRWVASFDKGASAVAHEGLRPGLPASVGATMIALTHAAASAAMPSGGDAPASGSGVEGSDAPRAPVDGCVCDEHPTAEEARPSQVPGDIDWAAMNAKNRRNAAEFMNGTPMFDCMLVRICMEPCMQYLKALLQISSPKWEQKQRATQLQGCEAGAAHAHGEFFCARDFPVTLQANGVLDDHFRRQIRCIATSADMWAQRPCASFTVAARALAFRVASKPLSYHEKSVGQGSSGVSTQTLPRASSYNGECFVWAETLLDGTLGPIFFGKDFLQAPTRSKPRCTSSRSGFEFITQPWNVTTPSSA